jgi:4'-phosphopantetheinyl transferase
MTLPPNAAHCVDLWLAPLAANYDAAQLTYFETLLDVGERARWQRFRFAEDRERFLVGRAFLRTVLARTLGRDDPAALQFVTATHGKPELAGNDAGKLHFNLSHTDAMLVLATSARHALGVDVEALTRTVDLLPLAQRYFTQQEYDDLRSMQGSAQRERFFTLWTLKEAWLKACGLGLRVPLDSFSFALSGTQPQIVFGAPHDDSPERWQLRVFACDEFRIALAVAVDCVEEPPLKVQLREWPFLSAVIPAHAGIQRPY